MDFFRQLQLINEAFAIEHNLPIKRQFTSAELEQPIEQVREAAELLSTAQPEAAKGEK